MRNIIKFIILKLIFLIVVNLGIANSLEHPFGKPVNIITFDDQKLNESPVKVDYEALDLILLHPEVKDRQIVVLSIVGAFRKGKSFFLNYCLRFLYANFKSVSSKTNQNRNLSEWMGDREEPLNGFSFKGGSSRDTTGMIFWSDVFLYDDIFEDKIAIVVMDTQGLFDSKTPPADNTKIFALGTLISSIQIYNLNGVVQEDQLQYLQLATDFAKLAEKNNVDKDTKAFQNIVFLIRDWDHLDDYPAGIQGGEGYLSEFLEIKDEQNPILRSVRKYLHQSFNKISCYLLPEPGKIVRRSREYNGEWSKMDEDFKNALNETIIDILKPSELIPKRIDGNVLKASELRDFMAIYFQTIESGETPKIETIYDITVRSQMNILTRGLLIKYKELLSKSVNFADPSFNESIEINHQIYKNYTILLYGTAKKMGSNEHKTMYQQQLNDEIDMTYNNWKELALKNYEVLQEQIRETEKEVKKKEELRKKLEVELKNTQDRIQEITNMQSRTNSKHDEQMKNLLESLQRQQQATLNAQNAQKAMEHRAQEAAQAVKESDKRIRQLEDDKANTDKAVAAKKDIIDKYIFDQTKLADNIGKMKDEIDVIAKENAIWRRKIAAKNQWFPYDKSKIVNLVPGGDFDNETIFVCRIRNDSGDVINGELPNKAYKCFITWNDEHYSSAQFEYLAPFKGTWNQVKDEIVPSCAVEGGRLTSGKELYICRVKLSKGFRVGSVLDGKCLIPKTSSEEAKVFTNYQIACV